MPAVREVWADGPSLLASLIRHWVVIAVTTGTLGGAAYLVEASHDPVFETAAQLEFADVQRRALDPDEPAPGNPARRLSNRTGHLRSQAVLERASALLDGAVDAGDLRATIEIHANPYEADSVTILARDTDPDQAAAIANAVAQAYREIASERERERLEEAVAELDKTIGRLQHRLGGLDHQPAAAGVAGPSGAALQRRSAAGQLAELATRRERLAAAALVADAGVTAYDPAPPGWQVAPSPARMGALGAFLGLALASAYAYWREGGGGAARSAEDVRAVLHAPLFARLPRSREPRWRQPGGWRDLVHDDRESYRFLGLALDRALSWLPAANIAVTGVRPHRGNAAVALNTAIALCHEHRRVVLVDADLRNRRLTSLWRLEGEVGLADIANPRLGVRRAMVTAEAAEPGTLSFMPAGTPPLDPFSCLRETAVPRLLEALEAERAPDAGLRVVLHPPPVLQSADAGAVAGVTDGVLLVVFKGTDLTQIAEAGETIEVAGGRLLGFVFVGGRPTTRRQRSPRHPRRAVPPSPVGVR